MFTEQAIKIAVNVVINGGDVKWAGRIFDRADAQFDLNLAALDAKVKSVVAQGQDIQESAVYKEYLQMQVNSAAFLFTAASVCPVGSETAKGLRVKALNRFDDVSEINVEGYHDLMGKVAPICLTPENYPGAVEIVTEAYDDLVLGMRNAIAEMGASADADEKKSAQYLAWQQMCLDGDMLIWFYGVPALADRALPAFKDSLACMKSLDPQGFREDLWGLQGAYMEQRDKSRRFDEGMSLVMSLIEFHIENDNNVKLLVSPERPNLSRAAMMSSASFASCLLPVLQKPVKKSRPEPM